MTYVAQFVALTLILSASVRCFVSCNQNGNGNPVDQVGLVEVNVGVRHSKNYSQYLKALRLLKEKKFSEAISIYRNLCKVEEDSFRTYSYMGLGSAYLMSNNYQNAIQNYNLSINLNNENAEAYVGLGSAYFSLTDYNKAIEFYSKAKQIDPNNSNSFWGLAFSFDQLHMVDSAKANARRFLQLKPDSEYRNLLERIINE